MSPRLPPGPIEENPLSIVVGIIVGLFVAVEFRRQGRARWWLRGVGFGILVAVVSVFNLPVGVAFGAVVFLAVRD